ncbi:adenylate/guanylate cyclase domain-containing protein [Bradyrhizobium sp. SYSU BS000235]|uniref:adenylate/guanylate cyclase domain-containing protein n=1 Tax=Bradyrhizobium sp. SYSU BS000235 TaxID=3411332 RepID=UPI003C742A39
MKAHHRPGIAISSPSERASPSASALAIIEWLGGNECHDLDDAALVGELGRRLSLAGLPLDRLSLHFRTLHPALAGRTIAWAPDEPVEVYEAGHAAAASMTFRENPVAQVMDAGECLVVRAGDPSFPSWNGIGLFKGRALREFFVAPLSTGEGPIGIAVFGTLRVKGFSAMEHALLERILPCLRTAYEFRALRRLELPLLDRFSGARTAERMLASGLLSYKTESTDAALMLVKFEPHVADLEPSLMEETIRTTASIVSRLGGFVLSIDDESMLAMFPQEAKAACLAAVAAAEHITEKSKDEDSSSRMSPGVVLHYGELTYGQIATPFGARLATSGRDVHHLKKLGHVASHGIRLSQHFSALVGMTKDAGLVSA